MHHHTENLPSKNKLMQHEREAAEKELRKQKAVQDEKKATYEREVVKMIQAPLNTPEEIKEACKDLERLTCPNTEERENLKNFSEAATGYQEICSAIRNHLHRKYVMSHEAQTNLAATFLATKYGMTVRCDEVVKNDTKENAEKIKKTTKKQTKKLAKDAIKVLDSAEQDLDTDFASVENKFEKLLEEQIDKLGKASFPDPHEEKERLELKKKCLKYNDDIKKAFADKAAATRRMILQAFTHENEIFKNFVRSHALTEGNNAVAVYVLKAKNGEGKTVVYK